MLGLEFVELGLGCIKAGEDGFVVADKLLETLTE